MANWEAIIAARLQALRLDSIRHKILAFAILATLIPSVITGTISYVGNRRSLTDKLNDQLRVASFQSAREIDLWLKERLYELRVFSSSYEVTENLERLLSGATTGGPALARLTEYLKSVRVRSADYEEMMVTDPRGRVLASSSSTLRPVAVTPDWLHDIRSDQAVVGEAYWDTTLKKTVIVLAVPISRNDRGLGAFAARISLDPVATILARFSPGDSGEVSLLTGNGKLIITSRTSSPKLIETQLDEHSSQRLFSQVGNPVQYADLEGRDVVGILQRVPRLDGAVVAAMPQVEAYRQVTRLRDVTVLMVAGLLLGVGLIAYGLGLVIVRPLNRLTAGAAKVAAGDLEVDLPVISGGEVGYLTEVFNNMVLRLRESRKELERLSVTDGLTGLANRRRLMQALGSEVVRAERNAHAFSVLMVDVDHFKKFNDTFGHPAGDAVLARVATILREVTRDVDLAARYGGEEFLLVLAETMTPGALEVAERIRTRLATEVFDGGAITVSVGVAQFPEDGRTAEALIMSADLALYQAKKKGRDRIVQASPETAAGKDPDDAA